jgi:hypothetical protein
MGSNQIQVVTFLQSRNLEYYREQSHRESSSHSGQCDKLTAVIPNSSKGFFSVTDIRIEFHFDRECRLGSYSIEEHTTLP